MSSKAAPLLSLRLKAPKAPNQPLGDIRGSGANWAEKAPKSPSSSLEEGAKGLRSSKGVFGGGEIDGVVDENCTPNTIAKKLRIVTMESPCCLLPLPPIPLAAFFSSQHWGWFILVVVTINLRADSRGANHPPMLIPTHGVDILKAIYTNQRLRCQRTR